MRRQEEHEQEMQETGEVSMDEGSMNMGDEGCGELGDEQTIALSVDPGEAATVEMVWVTAVHS